MIFYFTGTGNSEAAAKQLLNQGERLISMAQARQEEQFSYSAEDEESVGFVFPVYFYGLPDTVRAFASKLTLDRKPSYVYAVITCGGSIAGAGDLLKKELAGNGIPLRAVYTVKMPDNYCLMYEPTTPEQEGPILAAADVKLAKIREDILCRRIVGADASLAARLQTAALYPMYDRSRKTAKFYTDERCIGCGTCARRCPVKAIEMVNGRPVWVKESCDHCLSCVSCNAIQYGNAIRKRYRYKHPSRRKHAE